MVKAKGRPRGHRADRRLGRDKAFGDRFMKTSRWIPRRLRRGGKRDPAPAGEEGTKTAAGEGSWYPGGVKSRRTAHTVYQLAYHFVWIPKYRRSLLGGPVGARLKEILHEICTAYEWMEEDMLDRIEREISLTGSLTAEQCGRLLEIAERCPVHRTLTSEIYIRAHLV